MGESILRNKELEEILLKAGWFEGRKIDINDYLSWYQRYGFHPSISVIIILEKFGNLTLRIPFFQEIARNKRRKNAYWQFHISPLYFIDDTFGKIDIDDSMCYVNDINRFMNLSLSPVAEVIDSDKSRYNVFMADTGEIIDAYEGACGFLGYNFKEALTTLMTRDCDNFQDFQ